MGFCLVVFSLFIALSPFEPLHSWLTALENVAYDREVRRTSSLHPLSDKTPIAIVDIDDASIKEIGRWPWSRDKMAELVTKLYQQGATCIAFDVIFPYKQENIAEQILASLNKNGAKQELVEAIEKEKPSFDQDEKFAKSLSLVDTVLGMVFTQDLPPVGDLPPPFFVLTGKELKELNLPSEISYLTNIPLLQESAKNNGFINATPDSDGVIRKTPIVLRYQEKIFPSLALSAVSTYLLSTKKELKIVKSGRQLQLEGVVLDETLIPTDHLGKMLIPFRGGSYTFPYISAADVLKDKVGQGKIENKLLFIGTSATGLGEWRSTAISHIYPSIEIHASVAAGILDHYLPYSPDWAKGLIFLLMLVVGLALCWLLPRLGALSGALVTFGLCAALFFLNRFIWVSLGLLIPMALPLLLFFLLYVLNAAWGFFVEGRKRKELKTIFGQYVPGAYLDKMLHERAKITLEGESKELTVLFADICSFTTLSEKLTPNEIKQLLNLYLTPMTEVIFEHKGTIDKYVGDMIMAFWGAPVEDPQNAYHAVLAALQMQKALDKLNLTLSASQKPNLEIGIGINTGIMNVGDMGSQFRRAYTVLGDAVNLGSRLEVQTRSYHVNIIVGENTWQKTKDDFIYRKLDRVLVKGKAKAVDIYQPLCKKGEENQELLQELELHKQALEAYFKEEWEKAAELFDRLNRSYPKALYNIYLGRLKEKES